MRRPQPDCCDVSLAVLIGSPVAHSLSPVIHRAAFAAAGIDWAYAALDVAPGDGAAAVDAMRVLGLGGMSVTMPHKADVAAAVDRLDPAARSLQSVNTVSWDGDQLVGSSTDGAGFVSALAEIGIDVEGARVAIIGAGGAARSVIDALGRAGTKDITVLNRSEEAPNTPHNWPRRHPVGDRQRRRPGPTSSSTPPASGWASTPSQAGLDDLPCDPATAARRPDRRRPRLPPAAHRVAVCRRRTRRPHRRRSRDADPPGRPAATVLARHPPRRGRHARRRRSRPRRPLTRRSSRN